MKILIVDDNNDDRKLLRFIIERHGHEVAEARDGQEGLESAAQKPDLIISDVLMPVMDGFRFLIHLKKNGALSSIPFIFYSATYTEERDVQLGLSLGADDYIVKPKSPAELWLEVEKTLGSGARGQEPGVRSTVTEKTAAGLPKEEEEYLKRYSESVAIKLEDKIGLLEESEKKFRDLTERSPVGVYILQSGALKYINPRFAEIFGYTVRELADGSCANIVLSDDLPRMKECISKRLEGMEAFGHYPFRGIKKNGELIHLEVYSSRTIYEGNPAIIGTLLDITERKRAEEELVQDKEFSDTLNRINAIIHSTLDFDEIMRAVNDTAALAMGAEASVIGFREGDRYLIKYAYNMPEEVIGRLIPAANAKGTQLAVEARDVLAFDDALNDERLDLERMRAYGIRSLMVAPLISRDAVLGTLGFLHRSKQVAFTARQIDFARKLAASASLALENARLFAEIKQVRQRAAFFADAIENASQPFASGYPDGRLLIFNKAYAELSGYSPEELRSKTWSVDLTPPEWREHEAKMLEELHRTGQLQTYEKEYVRKDGSKVPVEIKVQMVTDPKGAPSYYYGFITDITARKQMEEVMRHMAHHDALTDLPNRRFFSDLIRIECAQARRHKTRVALLFLDLDRFKEVNDTLGHEVGDALLKEVAVRLRANVRESDTISRIGGDEFNIVLADIAKVEDISDVARKITEAFRKSFSTAGYELHSTSSIGISIYPDDSEDIDTLFRYADIAMYYAKEQGRNTFQFYNPAINIRSLERMKLESMLRQTIDRGELVVYYQPQINIFSRKMLCAEALVRWNHPERGILEPKQFIPAAEDTGFIMAIDEFVLRTACAQVRAWLDAGLSPVCVTVNLSAREFQDPELVKKIERILKETGAPPHCLDVEITESLAMSNIERTVTRLDELLKVGVHTSIDDFGTGYSSLNYLKKLPIEKLKIDQSFVRDLVVNPDDRAIITAVTAMAHSMRMRVLAEGVETEEQLAFLRDIGCEEIQGYLSSRPVPAEEFEKMLMTYS